MAVDTVNEFSMAGGNGIQSYTKNSSYQRSIIDASKLLIEKSIHESFLPVIRSTKTFCIADLGCSVGPNTFIAVDNIIEAIELKLHTNSNDESYTHPEFQVHFSDHICNDFNTLLKSLPPDRKYYASVAAGSFYTRLFPPTSLHFVHSSTSLHWISQVPLKVINKGRIHYTGADEEVIEAYSKHHAMDFTKFLDARAQEVVPGGLVALVFPARPNEVPHSKVLLNIAFDLLGSCLMDLVRKGLVNEEEVDSFNVPAYFTTPQELTQVIKQNGRFNIERMESLPEVKVSHVLPSPQSMTLSMRAATEELLKEKFGGEILDEVYVLFKEKVVNAIDDIKSAASLNLFVLLKLNKDT